MNVPKAVNPPDDTPAVFSVNLRKSYHNNQFDYYITAM
jgi:hypothetical protein